MQDFFANCATVLQKYGFSYLRGAGTTLLLALVGTFFGCLIGFAVGALQTIPVDKQRDPVWKRVLLKILHIFLRCYVELFRGTPMIVQAVFIYYGLLQVFGIKMGMWQAGFFIVSINTPLCSVNRDYADTLRFAASLGVRYATCSGLIPSGGATTEGSVATRLSQAELTDILRTAVETAHSLDMELDFTSPGWLPEETLRSLGLQLIPSCGACLSNMAVTPDGTVVPCQSWLGGVTLGNVLTDPWEKIWTNPQCAAIRAESAKMEHLCQLQAGNRKEAEA